MALASTEEAPSVPDSFFPDMSSLKAGSYDDTKPRFVPFDSQVAGHDGVLSDENGYIIIKPCNDVEVAWYEQCLERSLPIVDCMPAFMGVLELKTPETIASIAPEAAHQLQAQHAALSGKGSSAAAGIQPDGVQLEGQTAADSLAYSPPQASHERAVVLENLAYGYTKPCIVDIKLGRVLATPDAPQAKQDRLAAVAARTTSGSLGARIAGMRVWRSTKQSYSKYDRDWGKSLDDESIYTEGLLGFFSADLRLSQKQMIASRMLRDVQACIECLEDMECRIYSPSLLLVYEGDQTALNHAIEDEGRQLIEEELGHGLQPETIELGVSTQSFTPAHSPELESESQPSLSHQTSIESDGSLPPGALKLPMTGTLPYSSDSSDVLTASSKSSGPGPRTSSFGSAIVNSPAGANGNGNGDGSNRSVLTAPTTRPQLPTPHPSTTSIHPACKQTPSSASTTGPAAMSPVSAVHPRAARTTGGGGGSGDDGYAPTRSRSGSDLDSEVSQARDFYSCRLIDFAHATFTPKQGCDNNILDGLRATKRLLRRYASE